MIDPEASSHLALAASSQGSAMQEAYYAALAVVSSGFVDAEGVDRDRLYEVQSELDMLAHSRQQSINLGELCSLLIFAGITVALALLARPAATGINGFFVDLFATLLSAVVVFLTVNVWDLQRDREDTILEFKERQGCYGVKFQDVVGRAREQSISIAAAVIIGLVYAGLLLVKWDLVG